jgi:hypothetical protein
LLSFIPIGFRIHKNNNYSGKTFQKDLLYFPGTAAKKRGADCQPAPLAYSLKIIAYCHLLVSTMALGRESEEPAKSFLRDPAGS